MSGHGLFRPGGFFPGGGIDYSALFTAMGEPTGFVNRTDSDISFVDGTRTFTIEPSGADPFEYYIAGTLRQKSAAETIVIPNTEGVHFIYYDDETLSETTTFSVDLITTHALIAAIYWDVSAAAHIYFGDERHGITMDGATHYNMHITKGAAYVSGLGPGNFAADGDGSSDTHAQFSIADGVILDEDIFTTVTDGSPQDITPILQAPLYFRSGASDWNQDAATNFPVKSFAAGANRLAWNQFTGGAWQQTEVANGAFVLAHIYAINDIENPIIAVQGQATYGNIPAAREGAETEIVNLATIGLPFAEAVAICSVIFQTGTTYANAVKARVRTTDTGDNYVDFRRSQGISAGNPFGLPEVSELEVVSVRFAGAKGDGVTDDYDAIDAAITAIDTDEQTLYFSAGTYYIGTSLTIPSNVNVIMDRGATVVDNGDAGVVITIQGNLAVSPNEDHFDLTGAGSSVSIANTYKRTRVQEELPSSVSDAGNTTETDLMTFTLPQDAHLNHDIVRIVASGTITGSDDTKELKFYCGTDSVTFHPALNITTDWRFVAEMTLTGASERRCSWVGYHESVTHGYDVFTTDDLSAGDIVLKVTSESVDVDDTVTQTEFVINLL